MPTLVTDQGADLISKLQQLYVLARNSKKDKYEGWDRNYKLLNNRLGGRTSLTVGSWPPSPRDSEIFPICSTIVAWIADQNTNIDLSAACDPGTPYYQFQTQQANDLADVMQSNWLADDEAAEIKLMVWDALCYNAGFIKAVWDQSLAGGLGNAKGVRVDPYSLYVDPTASSLETAEYIIEVRKMSIDEVERRWPGSSTLIEHKVSGVGELDSRPTLAGTDLGRIPKANPGSLPGGNGRWGGVSSGNQYNSNLAGIVVYEFWLRENDEEYGDAPDDEINDLPDYNEKQVHDRWRIVVMAANEILLDEYADELYTFAGHPYERYLFDDIGELYGISLVDHLAYPQIYINRLLSAMQANAELVGNPIFLEAANSGLDRVGIINRPGQRLRVTGTAGMQNKPDWLQPPSMPQQVQQLVEFWIGRMENIAGISAASKGHTGTTRTSDQVMTTIQEAAFVRIRSAIGNLEHALTNLGYKLADLIIDNYTTPRFVSTAGPTGEKSVLALRARHFTMPTPEGAQPLKYTIQLNAGSAMPTSRQARAAQADRAYAMGLFDRQGWYEANQIPNWQQMENRIKDQMAQGAWNPPGARQKAKRTQ